jgi:hypothetical protein
MNDIDIELVIEANSYDFDNKMIKNGYDPNKLRHQFKLIRCYNNVVLLDDILLFCNNDGDINSNNDNLKEWLQSRSIKII